jgi:PAS domain S-box-containing protein
MAATSRVIPEHIDAQNPYLNVALIESLGVPVYTTDAKGRITMFNEAAAEAWGRRPKIGKDVWCGSWRTWWPDGRECALDECPMAICLKENRAVRDMELVVERPDGSRRNVLPYPSPLRDADGNLVGAVNVFVDVTERKRAEKALIESEERLKAELASAQTLHAISTAMIHEGGVEAVYNQVIDAAVVIMHSDMASMQIVDEAADALRMVAWRGFDPEFGKIFELNGPDARTSCSVARRLRRRVVVPDVENCDFIVGTPALEDHLKTGIRAVQSTPLIGRGGNVLGMISTHWRRPHDPLEHELDLMDVLARQAADLIERSQAEELSSRLAAVVQSSEDAIVSKDLNGVVRSWNRGAEQLFGYTAEEMIGQSIRRIIPEDRQEEEDDVLLRIGRGERVDHFETVRRRKDGSMVAISLTVSPVKDMRGRVIGASKIARDITEKKASEAAIQHSMTLKDQFLGLVSHELRTPIATIIGNGRLLLTRADRITEADRGQALEDVVAEGERLQRIVENLLLLTRLEATEELALESIELDKVAQEAIAAVLRRTPGRCISLDVRCEVPVARADRTLMALVLENLIGNAQKYSAADSPVEVVLLRNGAGQPELHVLDRGIGIDPEDLEKVFDAFFRSPSAKVKASGMGLGLAVCKRIIEAQGGSIRAELRPGGGCDFSFTLPALTDD